MRTDLFLLHAVSQIEVERTHRAAPACTGSNAVIKGFVVPVVGGGADIVEHRCSPFFREPALIFGAARHQIFGRVDGTVLFIADAVVAVTAYRLIAASAKQQR